MIERLTPDHRKDAAIEAKIFELLSKRQAGATICPSEVARALATDWRPLMRRIRQVALGLALAQRLRVTRGGQPVNAASRGGPIRLGWPLPTEADKPTLRSPPSPA